MPKSKRDKKISLTKTDKKGLPMKQHIIDDIQNCVQKFPNVFLFSTENMRNSKLKDLRTEWKPHSRFFFGKNRIMQIGLGKTETDEMAEGIHKLSEQLQGQCGLLFTTKSRKEVLDWFSTYSATEFARGGFRATKTVTLPEGPMEEFSHAIEPHLRALGMPTKLDRGIVTLYKEYVVCEKGKILTPEKARILKLINKPLSKFKIIIEACWTKDKGFELIRAAKAKPVKAPKPPQAEKKTKASKPEKGEFIEADLTEDESGEDAEGDDDDSDEEMEQDE